MRTGSIVGANSRRALGAAMLAALMSSVSAFAQGVAADPELEARAAQQPGSIRVGGVHGVYLEWDAARRLPDAGNGYFTFRALADKDIHVAISPVPRTNNPMYEIVIGAWANSLTYIRRSAQGQQLGVADKAIVHRGSWDRYWVRLDRSEQTISVGLGANPGRNVLLQAKDPHYVDQAAYIAFTTWESPVYYADLVIGGASGPGPGTGTGTDTVPASFRPRGDHGNYVDWRPEWTLPSTGDATLHFRAKGRNDIHVALSPSRHVATPMYEIVIGGWGNSRSVIRRSAQEREIAASNRRISSPGQWGDYWVRLERSTQTVSAGTGATPGQNVLIAYRDPALIDNAVHVSFSQWDTPVEYSNVTVSR